jgi:hypothetical protein
MPATIARSRRLDACIARLGVSIARAARILARDVTACQEVVDAAQKAWEDAPIGSCCKPILKADEYAPTCEHDHRRWSAREYLILAQVGAPATNAWPCTSGPAGISCGGRGTVCGRGYTENGVFKGATYECPRCAGKGWMDDADRKRCWGFDQHYTIPGL